MVSFQEVEQDVDRISDLPDSILCEILSHLPTKSVVATSILSTRWNNLCPFGHFPIRNLDLDDRKTNNELNPISISFINFVCKLLGETLLDLPSVESIRVSCKGFCFDPVVLYWVSSALRLRVKELELDVCMLGRSSLFEVLNGCSSLVKLVLYLERMDVKFPDVVALPKLKIVELYDLSIFDEGGDWIQGLLDGCSALEELSLVRLMSDVQEFSIRSRVLKHLNISEGSSFESTGLVDIDTPNLETLRCGCIAAIEYRVSPFTSMSAAHIDVQPYEYAGRGWRRYRGVAHIVNACSSTSGLYLGSRSIDTLGNTEPRLPMFHNLTWLRLGHLSANGWSVLGRLLSQAHNLKELTCEEGLENTEEEPDLYMDLFTGFQNFESSASNPICLEFHLEKIEFHVFNWTVSEMDLLEYFLKRGKVLEVIVIHSRPLDINTEFRILLLPNYSRIVVIESL